MDADQELTQLEELFGNSERLVSLLEKKGDEAQHWLDRLQLLVDTPNANLVPQLRSSILTVMIRLSKISGLHPKCLRIPNVRKLGQHPITVGGFGDVWKGVIGGSDGQIVCLKVVKVYLTSDIQGLFREYLREAIVWRQLKHPNVLPFHGIYYSESESQFCLVSPWMENGNLLQYLKATRTEKVNRLTLVHDVAAGLAYLHIRKVVHGDLKGVNVLITPDGHACLADFGLSRIADTQALRLTSSTSRPAGTARWMSPEMLNGVSGPTKESDVYAFGCVCYEIFTSLSPFHELPNEMAVAIQVVVHNKRPERPQGIAVLTDEMWRVMKSCWHIDPRSRPIAGILFDEVEKVEREGPHVSFLAQKRPFNHAYIPVLQLYFSMNPMPRAADRKHLATDSGMSARQIEVWFQNQRRRAMVQRNGS
ncbi:hypothetical protein PQX77_021299 [Marasmius sp. AFHP31]|nr:hypothetical protein PQX77_021299 [Marasmius sp. AFHP31]